MSYYMFCGKRIISYMLLSCFYSFSIKYRLSDPFEYCNARTLYLYIAVFKFRWFFYLRLGEEVEDV